MSHDIKNEDLLKDLEGKFGEKPNVDEGVRTLMGQKAWRACAVNDENAWREKEKAGELGEFEAPMEDVKGFALGKVIDENKDTLPGILKRKMMLKNAKGNRLIDFM